VGPFKFDQQDQISQTVWTAFSNNQFCLKRTIVTANVSTLCQHNQAFGNIDQGLRESQLGGWPASEKVSTPRLEDCVANDRILLDTFLTSARVGNFNLALLNNLLELSRKRANKDSCSESSAEIVKYCDRMKFTVHVPVHMQCAEYPYSSVFVVGREETSTATRRTRRPLLVVA
jgi:hypothetical protein